MTFLHTLRFLDSIITNFQSTVHAEDPFINPPSLFDEHKPFVLINNPFCEKNKNKSNSHMKNTIFQ